MMALRKSNERGSADYGWLKTKHTFSFADYYDPDQMGFRALRVINEDVVAPGTGFPTHPHRDMEIITYIIEGALAHKDTLGNEEVIRPGEVQRMSAGTGIRHSEFNPSDKEAVHLLQIWLLPEKQGLKPSYSQKSYANRIEGKNFILAASREGKEDSVTMNQDVDLYVGKFKANENLEWKLREQRHAWIQLVKGDLEVNGKKMQAGDGLAVSEERLLKITASSASEFLLFDLP